MVTEAELEALLKSHGWYLSWSKRYKTRYAYAKRRVGKTVESRYMRTENMLDDLTQQEVLKKIQ